MISNVPNNGFPALVYSLPHVKSPLSCLLSITNIDKEHTFITLRVSASIDGSKNKQTFMFLYKPNNLVPGKNSLKCVTTLSPQDTTLPPQDRLDEITRLATPSIRTLSLTLTEPCDILCPGSIAPKDSSDPAYSQFVNLARATEIYILFDEKLLHKGQCPGFVAQLKEMIAHPFDNYTVAKWSDLAPNVVSENLPTYNESHKRQIEHSSTSPSPSPKRVRRAPSPSKEAIAASTPSPKPLSSIANEPDFQEAIKNAVTMQLPKTLEAILPDMLLRLFPAPTLSPSTSTSSPSLSSLNTLISARLADRIGVQLEEIYTRALEDAEDKRDFANSIFDAELEDTRRELGEVAEVATYDFNITCEKLLHQFQTSVADTVDEAKEQAEEQVEEVAEVATHEFNITCEKMLHQFQTSVVDTADKAKEQAEVQAEEQAVEVAEVATHDFNITCEKILHRLQVRVAKTADEAEEHAKDVYAEFFNSLQGLVEEEIECFKKLQGIRQNATEDQAISFPCYCGIRQK